MPGDDVKVLARARATVTIEFDVDGGGWGTDCSVGQVHSQASRGATEAVQRLILDHLPGARVIGFPRIDAIIVPNKTAA